MENKDEYKKLSQEEIKEEVAKLQGWTVANGKLSKNFQFEDFVKAFGFMTQIAIRAEKMEHHPEWFNVYNRLKIELVTHDLGGISTYDIKLASIIDRLYSHKT
jgi:4a-hydroxytetrahydrobiopterin dehydratase